MPTSRSSRKQNRKSVHRRDKNRAQRSSLRSLLRSVREAMEGKDAARAGQAVQLAVSALDKAAKTRLIHPNAAARHKSRLAKGLRKLAPGAAGKAAAPATPGAPPPTR
ncbi:MAG: 30S ribosomal protein S20 [Planctomycetales bacterium]|nr:30S ribosomal protein S20 [Planctomycetales bacterium]